MSITTTTTKRHGTAQLAFSDYFKDVKLFSRGFTELGSLEPSMRAHWVSFGGYMIAQEDVAHNKYKDGNIATEMTLSDDSFTVKIGLSSGVIHYILFDALIMLETI